METEQGAFSVEQLLERGKLSLKQEKIFTFQHIGINCKTSEDAEETAHIFETIFKLPIKPGNRSIFVGSEIELMRKPYLGDCGHIAFAVANLEDGIQALEAQKIEMDWTTAKYDQNHQLKAVYLSKSIGGFAIHLVKSKND